MLSSLIILRQSSALRELETLGNRGLYEGGLNLLAAALTDLGRSVRYPETPRNSGWPTVSGQPLRCLNVIESSYGILGASWM